MSETESNVTVPTRTQTPLECPACHRGQGALHHATVEAYFRRMEDSEDGTAVLVSPTGAARGNMARNPSDRRDGIRIGFRCECGAHPTLSIAQHKGATLVCWESVEGRSS